ncbi:MobC family plasmid mobilization relaxosome protein [Ruminococcaceae bacterium OttesenSCG-928-L11]|nr:MobC family plasmid mobilization relaxosome protein [Ruminococcaceae bacterium OttesenSCG-928-L11]
MSDKKVVNRTRPIQVNVRLNQKEYNRLLKIRRHTGWTQARVIQSLIEQAELKERSPVEWPELLRQISAIGNNINQIARVANTIHRIDPQDWEEVKTLQTAIWQKMMDI